MPLAGPTGTRHRTKQEFVYRTLRDAIMRCDLRPGERLVIDDLARQLEVSIIPVREALQLLQSETLVVNIPYVGATVAPLSRESIIDVFSVLEGLETVATRLATERARPDDLDALARIVGRMDAAVAASESAEWADLNTQFHLAVSALPGLDMLRDLTARTLDRWDRVRRFYFNGVLVHRIVQAQDEHRAILEAMLARDVARLQELVRVHNQGALAAYISFLSADVAVAADAG
jgi:DNA-binding GntR family transcriptional regulator